MTINEMAALGLQGQYLSIIIVSWNTVDETLKCLEAVNRYAPSAQIIVVDNASSDDSVPNIRKEWPNVELLELDENAGFSKANNLGAAKATRSVLCFLNSDAYVEQSLDPLAEQLINDSQIGIIAPQVHFPNGRVQMSCGRELSPTSEFWFCGYDALSPIKSPWHFWRRHFSARWWKKPRNVDWVSGCCLLIRQSCFWDIGGWDERYFAYCEDTQLCHDCRTLGLQVVFDPSIRIEHIGGASFHSSTSSDRLIRKINSTLIYLFDTPESPEAQRFLHQLQKIWSSWLYPLRWADRCLKRPGIRKKIEQIQSLLEKTS